MCNRLQWQRSVEAAAGTSIPRLKFALLDLSVQDHLSKMVLAYKVTVPEGAQSTKARAIRICSCHPGRRWGLEPRH